MKTRIHLANDQRIDEIQQTEIDLLPVIGQSMQVNDRSDGGDRFRECLVTKIAWDLRNSNEPFLDITVKEI